MQTRGLDRAAAVRVIIEGFFEPLISEVRAPTEPLEQPPGARWPAPPAEPASAREDIEAYATSR